MGVKVVFNAAWLLRYRLDPQPEVATTSMDTGGEAFPDADDDECMSKISVEMDWSREEEEKDVNKDPALAELEKNVSESDDDGYHNEG